MEENQIQMRNLFAIQEKRTDDLRGRDIELFEMIKKIREKFDKLFTEFKEFKKESESMDLNVFAKLEDLTKVKNNLSSQIAENRLYVDDKFLNNDKFNK